MDTPGLTKIRGLVERRFETAARPVYLVALAPSPALRSFGRETGKSESLAFRWLYWSGDADRNGAEAAFAVVEVAEGGATVAERVFPSSEWFAGSCEITDLLLLSRPGDPLQAGPEDYT
ncbi:MAG TPA: hypothetical protein VGG85_05185 [Terracidiphilus sp.]|jgi:hypothetical protein